MIALLSIAFLATIPAANWMVGHIGTVCSPICTVPVLPGVPAPSGSLVIGIALVLRNFLQLRAPRQWIILLIAIGGLIAAGVAPVALAIASASAFMLGELTDWAVFTPLRRRRLTWAIICAGASGAVMDAFVFITLAFGSAYWLMPGQIVAKVWASLIAVAAVRFLQTAPARIHA